MNKDSFYFPHDSDATEDPKIMVMMAEWGLEAYGIYWIVIEHLRKQPGYKSRLPILKALAVRYQSSEEKFRSVVTRYDLFVIEDEEFFSLSLIARMKPLNDKREKMRELANKKWDKMRTHSVGNAQAMQVKESKVKESKEEYINNWLDWGKMIVEGNDQFWDDMRGRKVSQNEMDEFISIATRNGWDMESQQSFRVSLKGFKSNNPQVKKNVNPGKT